MASTRKRDKPEGRPEDKPDNAQMREVARLFYLEDLTRQAIAEKLKIDPRKVTWLLQQARELGVVRIDIPEPPKTELAVRLQNKFGLEKALIAPGPEVKTPKDYDDFTRSLSLLAADYFEELLKRNPRGNKLHVGLTGGDRVLAFVNAMPQAIREDLYIHVTALIGRGKLEIPNDPAVAASILWSRSGTLPSHCEYATLSPYDPSDVKPGSDEALSVIRKELRLVSRNAVVREVIEDLEKLDVVFASFAVLAGRTMNKLLDKFVTPKQLADSGAIGFFSYCPFGQDGTKKPEWWRLFMTAGHYESHWGIDFFKHMVETGKKVVGFGGGTHHAAAIEAALKARIINVLIIDEYTARLIVESNLRP